MKMKGKIRYVIAFFIGIYLAKLCNAQTAECAEIQMQTEFKKEVESSEMPLISSEILKYMYLQKENLSIHGDGYTILIHGENIVNYENEFHTKIKFQKQEDGISFQLNDGKELCGPIRLHLDGEREKYLYLYNTSEKKYQRIQCEDMSELELTTAGTYLLTDTDISDYKINKMIVAGDAVFMFAVLGIYVGVKKRYWFW